MARSIGELKFAGAWLAMAMVGCGGEGDAGSGPPDDELEARAGGHHPPPGVACEPIDVDPRRAIFETNVAVLEPFTLEAVLHHAAKNAGYKVTPEETYQRIIDTYATAAQGRFDGQHCDDELPDPTLTDPNSIPCGLLGCDANFFCAAHDEQCFACSADGSACEPRPGMGAGEVCGFTENGLQLCSFDGRHVTDCAPVEDDACDDAGCDPLGCDAVELCDTSFELCITCTAELDQCRIDRGAPDEPVETVCNGLDACSFDVDAGTVSSCEPDPECEAAQCGPLGCDAEFFCTSDFNFCFQCSGDGQLCELEGQDVPSPSSVCNFSTEELCTFVDGTIESCMPDTEGVCFGGGGTEETGDATATSFGFIVSDVTTDPTIGGSFEEGGFVSTGGSEVDGGSFDEGGFVSDGGSEVDGGSFDEGGTSFGEEGGDGGEPGFGALHGYPLECPRIEADQIDNMAQWFPISISNRFDLAPEDGANCGQQRIVFANNAQGRMFMIFEAQIPNPNPGCGLAACRPVVEFWAQLDGITDVDKRRKRLKRAFLTGDAKLEEGGFGPFVDARHYAFGTGQVRTNNFDQFPWTLREFKLVEHPRPGKKSLLYASEVPVTYGPSGDHWNDALDTPLGAECRDSFLDAMEGLMTDEPNAMHFAIAPQCQTAESRDDATNDFAQQLVLGTGAFEAAIETRLAELGSPLTAIDVAERARFAGACIGCHEQSNGADLGNGIDAPFSAGFTHTMEFFTESCGEDGEQCFAISDALSSSFLPHRKSVMEDFLATTPCEGACAGPYPIMGDGPIDVRQALSSDGRPDIRRLRELELRARAQGAKRTVGGGSTRSTH
ncbi:MAG TPA: hypothetical protein VG755_21510 [Nannocystaceae bacterium]|nr:hypothetical protein [Nannocystaceae bacterium]